MCQRETEPTEEDQGIGQVGRAWRVWDIIVKQTVFNSMVGGIRNFRLSDDNMSEALMSGELRKGDEMAMKPRWVPGNTVVLALIGTVLCMAGCGRTAVHPAEGFSPGALSTVNPAVGSIVPAVAAADAGQSRFILTAGIESGVWDSELGLFVGAAYMLNERVGITISSGGYTHLPSERGYDFDFDEDMLDFGVLLRFSQGSTGGPYIVLGVASVKAEANNDGSASNYQVIDGEDSKIWLNGRLGYEYRKNHFACAIEGRLAIGDHVWITQEDPFGFPLCSLGVGGATSVIISAGVTF